MHQFLTKTLMEPQKNHKYQIPPNLILRILIR
jgi:hypothetical protein